jgi:hypothetical protein
MPATLSDNGGPIAMSAMKHLTLAAAHAQRWAQTLHNKPTQQTHAKHGNKDSVQDEAGTTPESIA